MGSWFTPDPIVVTGGQTQVDLGQGTGAFTVTLPDMTDGVNTITLNATHGTLFLTNVSGQLFGNGSANVVYTPDAGQTTFEFNFTGTSNGDGLITITNTLGFENPPQLEIFVGRGTSAYATFSDLEDWYGVDNITIYSNLDANTTARDFDRIQKWLDKAAQKINLAFKRVGRPTPVPSDADDFSALTDIAAEWAGAMLAKGRGDIPEGWSSKDGFDSAMDGHIERAEKALADLVFLWSENESDTAGPSTAGAITAVVGAPKQYPGTGSVRPPVITVPSLTGDVSW
jgi:hypothetical protein